MKTQDLTLIRKILDVKVIKMTMIPKESYQLSALREKE